MLCATEISAFMNLDFFHKTVKNKTNKVVFFFKNSKISHSDTFSPFKKAPLRVLNIPTSQQQINE